jgi:hypothetical protein
LIALWLKIADQMKRAHAYPYWSAS